MATTQMGEGLAEPDELALVFEEAEDILDSQPVRALDLFRAVLDSPREDEGALRLKEQSISK